MTKILMCAAIALLINLPAAMAAISTGPGGFSLGTTTVYPGAAFGTSENPITGLNLDSPIISGTTTIGTSVAAGVGQGGQPPLQIAGNGGGVMPILAFPDGSPARLRGLKTRCTTSQYEAGTHCAVQAGDLVVTMEGYADNGTDYQSNPGSVTLAVDGAPSGSIVKGQLYEFLTNASGNLVLVHRIKTTGGPEFYSYEATPNLKLLQLNASPAGSIGPVSTISAFAPNDSSGSAEIQYASIQLSSLSITTGSEAGIGSLQVLNGGVQQSVLSWSANPDISRYGC